MFPARHKHAKLRIKSDNIVRVVLETFKKGGFSTKKGQLSLSFFSAGKSVSRVLF